LSPGAKEAVQARSTEGRAAWEERWATRQGTKEAVHACWEERNSCSPGAKEAVHAAQEQRKPCSPGAKEAVQPRSKGGRAAKEPRRECSLGTKESVQLMDKEGRAATEGVHAWNKREHAALSESKHKYWREWRLSDKLLKPFKHYN